MKNVRRIGWIPAILLSSSFAIAAVYAVAEVGGGHVPGHVHKASVLQTQSVPAALWEGRK